VPAVSFVGPSLVRRLVGEAIGVQCLLEHHLDVELDVSELGVHGVVCILTSFHLLAVGLHCLVFPLLHPVLLAEINVVLNCARDLAPGAFGDVVLDVIPVVPPIFGLVVDGVLS
tara:strand:- start:399 stop:740 length:342 start_codon:yes stop_codon:yes gene_type:complete